MKLSDLQLKTINTAVQCASLSRWMIVKEHIPVATNASHVQDVYEEFKIAQRAKILPQNLRVDQYRGSKVVDLSTALTAPCPGWSEFEFKFFYENSVHSVFDWFGEQPEPPGWTVSHLLLASTLALILCIARRSSKTRLLQGV